MKSNWRTVKLQEIVLFKTGKLDSNAADEQGIYPFFTCSPATLAINKYAFNTEAVLLAGNNANGVFAVKYYNGKFNAYQRTYVITPIDKSVVSVRWLYFRIKHVTSELQQMSVGTATKFLTKKILDAYEVQLPPIEEQERQAKILWDLQNKLDLNAKTNQTLEQMAKAIFKSWFVDFDPVKAKMNGEQPEGMDAATASLFPEKLVESELGLIPEGWQVGELSDLIDFNPRRTLKKGSVAPYLDMKNMPTSGHLALDIYERELGSGTKFINGDSLLARITPCLENGKTAFVDFLEGDQVGWGSTEYIVMRSKSDSYKYFSYFMARFEPFRKFAIQSMTGTSGRQRAQAKTVQTMPFVIPPLSILEKFDELITANMKLIKRHGDENKTLAVLRDTLLPKLLSGDIELNANTNGLQEVNVNFDVEEIDSFIKSLQKELKEEDTLSLIYDPLYLEPIVTWFENKGALPFSAVLKIDDALESLNRYIPRYYDYNGFSGEQEEVDEKIQDYWGYGEPICVREVTKYCMHIARKAYLQTMCSQFLSDVNPKKSPCQYAIKISDLDVELMGTDVSNWFSDIYLINSEKPYVEMKRKGNDWLLTFPQIGPRSDYSECIKAGYESIVPIISAAFPSKVSIVKCDDN
ncbi:restriction endonuclease subunit S [Vibrio parahaemolyticus]|nr:restriction endonuclease subunit S [Vibrio parahaemolyticus]